MNNVPNTLKLFLDDSYRKQNQAVVQYYDPKEGNLFLNQTVFYARSGGQPGDKGIIEFHNQEKINVVDSFYVNEKNAIIHVIAEKDRETARENLIANTQVKAQIDWQYRYANCKAHTALHIICAVIPYQVSGCQIEAHKARIDFNVTGEMPNKDEINYKVNKIIKEKIQVRQFWIEKEKFEHNIARSMALMPPIVDGKIRVVTIEGYDTQACGGTHVANASEIGLVSIDKIENKGAKNRRIRLSIK